MTQARFVRMICKGEQSVDLTFSLPITFQLVASPPNSILVGFTSFKSKQTQHPVRLGRHQ